MIISVDKESADALYQVAEYLPKTLAVIAEQTRHLLTVYQSVSENIGAHQDDFLAMAEGISSAISGSEDTANELSMLFKGTADRIMEYIDDTPDQPERVLRRR